MVDHADKAKSQLEAWLEQPERHEQVAVGQDTSRTASKIEDFFGDINQIMKSEMVDRTRTAHL